MVLFCQSLGMTKSVFTKIHHFKFNSCFKNWSSGQISLFLKGPQQKTFSIADTMIISETWWAKIWCVKLKGGSMKLQTFKLNRHDSWRGVYSAYQHGEMALMAVLAKQSVTRKPDMVVWLDWALSEGWDFWNRKMNRSMSFWWSKLIITQISEPLPWHHHHYPPPPPVDFWSWVSKRALVVGVS